MVLKYAITMLPYPAFKTLPVLIQRDMDPYLPLTENGHDFPQPGEGFYLARLDLTEALIKNPALTYFIRLSEASMLPLGWQPGDILIVERGATPRSGQPILAVVDGEFLVRRLRIHDEGVSLEAENPDYPTIHLDPDTEFGIWGLIRDCLKP